MNVPRLTASPRYATERANDIGGRPRLRGRVVELFPASLFVLAPYVGLILPIAITQGNPSTGFIVGLLGLALLGTIVAETLLLPRRLNAATSLTASAPSNAALRRVTAAVVTISIVARLAYIGTGGGSLQTQLTGQEGSVITSLSALFAAWNLFAAGLLFACAKRGALRTGTMWAGIALLAAVELWGALSTTVTAPLVQFVSAVLLVALVLKLVRLRTLIIALVVVLVAWPTVYGLRNALRVEMGASVDSSVSAFDRLRFDEQLTAVERFEVPVHAGQIDVLQGLRYGVVPRVLDPGRPALSSARVINQILGGSTTSSFNFLSIGTLYFFYGPVGIVVFYFAAAILFCLVVSRAVRAGPIALCMMTVTASHLFGWGATFPDTVIGYLQALVSFLPILFVLAILRRPVSDGAEREHGRRYRP